MVTKGQRYRLIPASRRNAVNPPSRINEITKNCVSNSRCRTNAPCRKGFRGARSTPDIGARTDGKWVAQALENAGARYSVPKSSRNLSQSGRIGCWE